MSEEPSKKSISRHDLEIAEIRAILKETAQLRRENEAAGRETDRRLKKLEQQSKRTDKQLKRTERLLGLADNRWGQVAESLISGELAEIVEERFAIKTNRIKRNHKIYDHSVDKTWEIDIVGFCDDAIVLVEVKSSLDKSHINRFQKTILNRYTTDLEPEYCDKKIYGAVGFIRTTDDEEEQVIAHAQRQGLLVIKIFGRRISMIVNSKKFMPHNFCKTLTDH